MVVEKRLAYAAVLPVLLLSLRILPSDSPNGVGDGGRGRAQTLEPPASRHVVRFVGYRHAEEHREYLQAGLQGAGPPAESWRWVERRNPAAAFPTDFAVLEIRDAHRDAVMEAVRALGRVRDVHADAAYSRGVLSADRPPPWRGKLFTAMSFEDGGEKEVACSPRGNSSSATSRRKLLIQVPLLSSCCKHQRFRQDCFFKHLTCQNCCIYP
jgi:membrane-bound transcription factor site-1 protease